MDFQKSSRLQSINVSEIVKIAVHARQLKASGRPVVILGAGEPDFDTPENIIEAAVKAMHDGETHYTPLDGTPELKTAIQTKFLRDNNLGFEISEISAGAGAKQIIFNALMATLEPGDEVITPSPFWTSYEDIVKICGGRMVTVPCGADQEFLLKPEDLESAITPRTKWLLLNSPGNPTGAAYTREAYLEISEVLHRHPDVWLMSDEIYEHIVYDDFKSVSPVTVDSDLRQRSLIINGVSKSHAMTGWRLGFGAAPRPLIDAMRVVQSQTTSCPSSISQAAAIEALTGPQDYLEPRRQSFQERRNLVVSALNNMDGIQCPTPRGAFYTFASCAGLIGRKTAAGRTIQTDRDFCRYLLEDAEVAVVPGTPFGLSPFFRISYATSKQELQIAMQRMSDFIQSLD